MDSLRTNLNTQAALNFEQSYNIPIVQTNRAIWSCLRNIKLILNYVVKTK